MYGQGTAGAAGRIKGGSRNLTSTDLACSRPQARRSRAVQQRLELSLRNLSWAASLRGAGSGVGLGGQANGGPSCLGEFCIWFNKNKKPPKTKGVSDKDLFILE